MKKTTLNPIIHLNLNLDLFGTVKLIQHDTSYITIEEDDQNLIKVKDHKGHIDIRMKPTHYALWGKTEDGMRSRVINNTGIYAEGDIINGYARHVTDHPVLLEKQPKITIYAPKFPTVSVMGASALTIEELDQESLDIELLGSGSVQLNKTTLEQLSLALSGSGKAVVDGKINKIDARTSGSSDLSLDVVATTITIRSTGSSDIFLSGKSERLSAYVSGSGDIDGRQMETNYADLKATGSSDILMKKPLENCTHSCSGSGDIEFI